jgi:hypothetical protein
MRRSRKELDLMKKSGWPVVDLTVSYSKTHIYRLKRVRGGKVWEKTNT